MPRSNRTTQGTARGIGQRIREIRRGRGWTQADLADRLGHVDYRLVSSLENGRRDVRISTLDLVARALEIDLREILSAAAPDRCGIDEGMLQLVREGASLGLRERERLRRVLRALVRRR